MSPWLQPARFLLGKCAGEPNSAPPESIIPNDEVHKKQTAFMRP
jgi:hypothetical protein